MSFNGRNEHGHFAPGNSLQVSRQPTALDYRRRAAGVVTADEWAKVVQAALHDAVNGEDGATRHAGRTWLAKILGVEALKPSADAPPSQLVVTGDAQTEALARELARRLYAPKVVELTVEPSKPLGTNGVNGNGVGH